ncbi:branched-chain amino acid ABC transporter permease [Methylopila jiangsuensis]|uniref:Branched-chain amino acid ABC transporter permease n=1 Tax=Methylopila jiangsuensis TaxID=586230 RepID=A0A9W6JM18_9HYPH|nr:high-affinity branched-chain amino acid ABC transporter permease LivM [Methylopila jiangsuensis]MDR6284445.1 branched-chain amino acid transport system permease protein [Methylopila jiangsuensis]GLK78169.1 branched-chain amino acid ABC transporter permease [Methylopila jiangsuensis]
MAAPASPAAAPSPLIAAVKDAGIAALIALGLALPMLGLVTTQTQAGMGLVPHWDRVAIAVVAVFAGRLLLNLTLWRPGRRKSALAVPPKVEATLARTAKYLGPLAILFAIVMPLLPFTERYAIDLGILVLTYVMLGWGLNIVVGLAGLLDLGYVAFYAVGAYSYALLAQNFGLSFWICLPLAGILAAFWGVLLGFPVLRLRGDYLAIVTLAFGEIIRIVLLNWYWFTGGPNGISGIPRPTFFGIDFDRGPDGFAATFGLSYSPLHRILFLYYLILALALITNLVTIRLRRLPIGRAWEALREDEIACRSLGINTVNTKLTAFALGAMFAGFAGSFFATRQGFISPESFVFMESALILAIVVLGGMGSQFGVAVAAVVMIGGFELFREFSDYRMITFGLVMVLIMVWRPRGLVSSRSPTVFLKEKKAISGALVQEGHG